MEILYFSRSPLEPPQGIISSDLKGLESWRHKWRNLSLDQIAIEWEGLHRQLQFIEEALFDKLPAA